MHSLADDESKFALWRRAAVSRADAQRQAATGMCPSIVSAVVLVIVGTVNAAAETNQTTMKISHHFTKVGLTLEAEQHVDLRGAN